MYRVRLHGSYSALDAGKCFEATEDLTGGVTERFLLADEDLPTDLFSIMIRASQRGSLLTCCVPSAKKVKVTKGSLPLKRTIRASLKSLFSLRLATRLSSLVAPYGTIHSRHKRSSETS